MHRTATGPGIPSWLGIGAVAGCLISLAATAQTFKPVYLGDWTIVGSRMAPWTHPGDKPYAPDVRALLGKTITFAANSIRAPRPLGCTGARYKLDAYAPDLLFQGGLTDPEKQAASLGFRGRTIPTLVSGCDIEFHFIDADTALFALNNSIYRMERKSGASPGK